MTTLLLRLHIWDTGHARGKQRNAVTEDTAETSRETNVEEDYSVLLISLAMKCSVTASFSYFTEECKSPLHVCRW